MLSETMNQSTAAAAEVGAHQAATVGLPTVADQQFGGEAATEESFASAMGPVSQESSFGSQSVTAGATAASQLMGGADAAGDAASDSDTETTNDVGSEATNELDEDMAKYDTNGDGELSEDEALPLIKECIVRDALLQGGTHIQRMIAQMKKDSQNASRG